MEQAVHQDEICCGGGGGALVAAFLLLLFFGIVVPSLQTEPQNQYSISSKLEQTVDRGNLSTLEYVYDGIAEHHTGGWFDTVDYRVRYASRFKVSFDMSAIRFESDDDAMRVTVYLPDPEISSPELDETQFDYLPDGANANLSDVIALCKEDATNDGEDESDSMKQVATENLKKTIEALSRPIVGDEYTFEWKSLSEFNAKEVSDEK